MTRSTSESLRWMQRTDRQRQRRLPSPEQTTVQLQYDCQLSQLATQSFHRISRQLLSAVVYVPIHAYVVL